METIMRARAALPLVTLLAFNLFAAESDVEHRDRVAQQPATTGPQFQRDALSTRPAEGPGLLVHAKATLGQRVQDRQFKIIGNLDDLVLDLGADAVVAGIVSVGSGQVVIVPARCFSAVGEREVYMHVSALVLYNGERKTLLNAPRLSKKEADRAFEPEQVARTFAFFGQTLPQRSNTTKDTFCSAKKLLEGNLLNPTGDLMGKVKDIMVNVPEGQAAYVIVEPERNLDAQDNLFALPPAALRLSESGKNLVLAAPRERFLGGPHYPRAYETDMCMPEFANSVYSHYGLQFGGGNKVDPTHVPVRAKVGSAETPTTRQTGSDSELRRRFLTELVHEQSFKMTDCPEFRADARDGRLILSGRVKNQHVRVGLVAAAERCAGQGNVVDHLETE
jgi:sporulation protein YlmC with PRC-barrel domain